MSGETVAVASRQRAPPGGPLRSLLWWLRPPQRSSSSESVSSAGSDRTAVSFAFLQPVNYRTTKPAVVALPPPGPPTDSYRKRIRDRDLRRQLDREITLQRKYRLPSAADGTGYNAFSLPPNRRAHAGLLDRQERARRATSEYIQRRAAHVPGKRRAPQPPAACARHAPAGATLPRRSTRKRRAPPPPGARSVQRLLTIEEKASPADDDMDPKVKAAPEKRSIRQVNRKADEDRNDRSRNVKTKSEVLDHGFFKHCKIFDSKKRNSMADSPLFRVLPNISELDRQASEIYESCKLKRKEMNNNLKLSPLSRDGHPWICTKCLKKYTSDVIVCTICYPEEQKSTSQIIQQSASSSDQNRMQDINSGVQLNNKSKENRSSFIAENTNRNNKEEKEKLKEILKEMKHSLPKHPKSQKTKSSNETHESRNKVKNVDIQSRESPCTARDLPTLRIGCSIKTQSNDVNETTNDREKVIETSEIITQRPVITQITASTHFHEIETESQSSKKDSENNNTSQERKENPEKSFIEKNSASSGNLNVVSITAAPISGVSNLLNSNDSGSVQDNEICKKSAPENEDKEYDKYEHSGILKLLNLSNVSTDKIKLTDKHRNLPLLSNKSKDSVISSHLTKSEKISQGTQIDNEKNFKTNTSENSKLGNFLTPPLKVEEDNQNNPNGTATNAPTSKTSLFSNLKDASSGEQAKPIESVSTTQISKNQESQKDIQQAAVSTTLFPNSENRRRDLVNQLERSIAQGDEHAAAEAAMGLAKMRVPCSVLSAPAILNTVTPEIISKPLTITGLINSITSSTPLFVPKSSVSSSETSNQPTSHLIKPIVPTTSMHVKSTSSEAQKQYLLQNKSKVDKKNASTAKAPAAVNVTNNQPSTSSNVATTSVQQPNKLEPKTPKSTPNLIQFERQLQTVDVIVEDRELQRGPVPVHVPPSATLGELRRRAALALGIPVRLQRWIIGKTLCNDEETKLVAVAGPALNAPFYLCLVESETNKDENATRNGESSADITTKSTDNPKRENEKEVYKELVELERCALVPTGDEMECGVCLERCERGAGAVLRECLHAFCRECLAAAVRHCDEPVVACPAVGCGAQLQEREVKALVSSEDYDKWLARGLATAESGARHAFHCRTADCGGWALCEPGVRRFHCPVCDKVNCVPCQAIHEGETCLQHRDRALAARSAREQQETTTRDVDEGTKALLDSLVARGEALECPNCGTIITKKWGCDWVRCSACKTEICWVTRGRRWGPAGRGDTSGGCRCGVDGRRCHPSCSYCH